MMFVWAFNPVDVGSSYSRDAGIIATKPANGTHRINSLFLSKHMQF